MTRTAHRRRTELGLSPETAIKLGYYAVRHRISKSVAAERLLARALAEDKSEQERLIK